MLLLNQQTQLFLKGPWPPKITSALILVLMGWWAYANVLPMFVEKEEIAPPVSVVKKTQAPKKAELHNLNLFGKAEKPATLNTTNEAKETKLALTLRGVLATEDPKQGIAQIQNAQKQEKHFSVKDLVFGQATLEEVYADRVILLHNGRYETLLLPEESLSGVHHSNSKLLQERKKILTDVRDLFLRSDIDTLLTLFEFEPAFLDGGFSGFYIRVLGEEGAKMLARFGLLDGDLITVLNGLRFSESLEATQQLKELKYQTSADIIVKRDGQEMPFHLSVDEAVVKQFIKEEEAEIEKEKNSTTYKNTIDADGKVDRSGFTQSLIDSSDDEDIEPDWDENVEADEDEGVDAKAEAEAYRENQRKRTTGVRRPVEFDH